jgi:hypothetical protein
LSRAYTFAIVFYILLGQVSSKGGSLRVLSCFTLSIDLFLYNCIFLILALALGSHILEIIKALTIIYFFIACSQIDVRSRKKEVIVYSKSRLRNAA